MTWEDYLSIPWLRHGRSRACADCWGVVALWLQHEAGIAVPSYVEEMQHIGESAEGRDALIRAESQTWVPVSLADIRRHDVVLMRSGQFILHVGVMINSEFMLHSEGPEGRFPIVQRVDDSAISRRVIGLYRHQAL